MSKPKIYKPSIYNAPTVYNTGAGGGTSGSFTLPYETQFLDCDVNKGIDTPIKGNRTPFKNNDVTLSLISGGGLKVTSYNTNGIPNNFFCFFHFVEDVVELYVKFEMLPNSLPRYYNFLSGITYIISREFTNSNDLQFVVTSNLTYTLHNGAVFRYADGLGNRWINLNVNPDGIHEARIVFDKGTAYFYLDNTLYVTYDYGTQKIYTEKFSPDPRFSSAQNIYRLVVK